MDGGHLRSLTSGISGGAERRPLYAGRWADVCLLHHFHRWSQPECLQDDGSRDTANDSERNHYPNALEGHAVGGRSKDSACEPQLDRLADPPAHEKR